MSIHLETNHLINTQQLAVAVRGPDGATHLILCAGVAQLGTAGNETYTFLVGPRLSRRQFVGVIASGAISTLQALDKSLGENDDGVQGETNFLTIDAAYDDEAGQVKVRAHVPFNSAARLAISYSVNILAELQIH